MLFLAFAMLKEPLLVEKVKMKNEIVISSDRESYLYINGEPVEFTVTVYNGDQPARSGKLKVSVAQDGGPGNTTVQFYDLASSGNPVKIQACMNEPCFCLCQAWYEGSYAEKTVWYRTPEQAEDLIRFNLLPDVPLKASLSALPDDPPRPADFDAFWAETLQKARALPQDMQLEKLPQYSRSDADYYRFSMNTLNGDRVRGFLGVPTGKGPFPVIAMFPGKGPAAVQPIDCGWTAAGCITVMFNVHKYPIPGTVEESKQKMMEYAQSHGVSDYWNVGLEHREKFHFYSVLPGFCRVLDYVCSRFPWDNRRLVLDGGSQGGWMTLSMAALYRDRVSAAYAGVPAVGFLSRLPGKNAMRKNIPPYFEADYFAPRITAPILVAAGLRDVSCRADIISAMFTLIGSRDKTLEMCNSEHMHSPQRHQRERNFLRRVLGVSDSRPIRVPRQESQELVAVRGDMLQRYYLDKFHAQDRKRAARLAAVKSREDAEKYMAEIREKIKQVFGPMPPLQPISPRIAGQLSTGKLLIDKVLFQSRPGYYVSALFYRPKTFRKKLPGILFLCGHSAAGKQVALYQRVPQSLALRGFGVLVVDPYGQGERQEYGKGGTAAHNHFGQRLALLGEFFGTWRLHDALVSLEYLKSRPEIDPARLGATGCSGGGTLTSYLNAFSPDLFMAAPVCSMTRMSSNLENELTTDCEQNPPGFRSLGLDEDDFLLAYAPRPILLGVQDNDFFDPRGTEKMYQSMQSFYRFFGKQDSVKYSLGKGNHTYSVFHQQAIGEFFAALTGAQAVGDDEEIQLFKAEELFCAPSGSVWILPDARSTGQILADLLQKIKKTDKVKAGRTPVPSILRPDRIPVPTYRKGVHQHVIPGKLQASRFLIQTEPGIEVTLKKLGKDWEMRFPSWETAVIFLPEKDGIQEMDLRDYNSNKQNFFLLEVRGCGESKVCSLKNARDGYYRTLYSACGRMLGEEFLRGQIRDIVSTLKLLKKHGFREVVLIAEGSMYVAASAAAELSPLAVRLKLKNPPVGWEKFLLSQEAVLPLELLPFGILRPEK